MSFTRLFLWQRSMQTCTLMKSCPDPKEGLKLMKKRRICVHDCVFMWYMCLCFDQPQVKFSFFIAYVIAAFIVFISVCSLSYLEGIFVQDWWCSYMQVHCRHNSTVSMDTKRILTPPTPTINHPQFCSSLHPAERITGSVSVILSLSFSPSHYVTFSETWKCISFMRPGQGEQKLAER